MMAAPLRPVIVLHHSFRPQLSVRCPQHSLRHQSRRYIHRGNHKAQYRVFCQDPLQPNPRHPSPSSSEESSSGWEYNTESKTAKIPLSALLEGREARRTRLVQFTCNKCGGRTSRMVNPVAWEKGAVFAQCQHCEVWHTLVAAKHIVEEIRYNEVESLGAEDLESALPLNDDTSSSESNV